MSEAVIQLGQPGKESALPDPDSYDRSYLQKGAEHDLMDGSQPDDYTATKLEWNIGWQNLTGTERSLIFAYFGLHEELSFIDWDAAEYTVKFPLQESFADSPVPGTVPLLWNVRIVLREV